MRNELKKRTYFVINFQHQFSVYNAIQMLIRKLHICSKHDFVHLPTFTLKKNEICCPCLSSIIHNKIKIQCKNNYIHI